MITIFILELSAGISGYVLRNEAGQMLRGNLETTMKDYIKYPYIARLWDEVQTDVRTPNIIDFAHCINIKHFKYSLNAVV